MIIDENGRFIELFTQNDNLKLLRPKEAVIGLTIHQVIPEQTADNALKQVQQTILSGTPQCCVYELEIRESKRFYEIRMAPMSYLNDNKKTVAAVATDITEQILIQRRLQLTYELRRKSDFLNDIITGKTAIDERALLTAKMLGIDLSLPIVCCLLDFQQAESADLSMLKNSIFESLSDEPAYVAWDCRDGLGVLFQAKDTSWNYCLQLASQLKDKIARYTLDRSVTIGVSEMHTGTESIKNSFQQAWSAVTSAHCQEGLKRGIYFFRDLGIYQLLASLGGKEESDRYIEATIGNLITYDKDKGTRFLHTLELILQCTNLKEAAEKLFLHPKTLVLSPTSYRENPRAVYRIF